VTGIRVTVPVPVGIPIAVTVDIAIGIPIAIAIHVVIGISVFVGIPIGVICRRRGRRPGSGISRTGCGRDEHARDTDQ
jgi:hypothetical protein